MKLKKLITAVSTLAMLGSLLVAIPASATVMTAYETDENTTWFLKETYDGGTASVGETVLQKANDTAKGKEITLTMPEQTGTPTYKPIQVRPQLTDEKVYLEKGVEYTYSISYTANISSALDANSKDVVYTAVRAMYMDGTSETKDVESKKTHIKSNCTMPYNKTDTITGTITPTVDNAYLEIQLYFRNVVGSVTYSNISVTYEKKVPATGIKITSGFSKTLYKGESCDMTAVVTPENTTDEVIWSFSGIKTVDDEETTVDVTSAFTVENGKITYTDAGRVTDSGNVTVTATAGDVSDSTTINVQRLRHIVYTITDNSGEVPEMNVSAIVNDTEAYNENVTYGSKQHETNKYSGHSKYSMSFTVPDGYVLDLVKNEKYEITSEGNIVTVTANNINDDFNVAGTLNKATVTADAEKVYTDDNGDTVWTAELTNNTGYALTKVFATAADINSEDHFCTAIAGGTVKIAVVIANKAVDSVKVTLK